LIGAVVLAGGTSTRLGTPKQLLPYRNAILLAAVVQTLITSRVDRTVVVLGHRAEEIREKLRHFPVSFVYNPDYAQGQSTSIKAGLTGLGHTATAALFALGDQPLLQTATIDQMIASYRLSGKYITAPFYQGQRGNPVLFDQKMFPALLALSGDTGARQIIERCRRQVARVEVDDPGILFDIDTWEDYRRLTGLAQEVLAQGANDLEQ